MLKTVLTLLIACTFQWANAQEVIGAEPAKTIKGIKERVTYIAVSPKEDRVLVGFGEYAALYDIEKGKRIATFEHDYNGNKEIYYVGFDDDGDQVITIDSKGKRRFWDANSGELLKGNKALFGPDPREIIKLGLLKDNATSNYYYIQTETAIPNTKLVVKSAKNGTLNFVNTEDNKVKQKVELDNKDLGHLPPVVISPDGQWLITGTDKGDILFYSLN